MENLKSLFRFSKRTRFTLAELVVVLSGLVIILIFFLPSLFYAIGHAQTTQCRGNLTKIGQWIILYSNEYKTLPPWQPSWISALEKYTTPKVNPHELPKGAWKCPSQPSVSLGKESPAEWWRGSHYGINLHLTFPSLTPDQKVAYREWTLIDIRKIRSPAEKCLIADATGGNPFFLPHLDPVIAGFSPKFGTSSTNLPPDPIIGMPYLRHVAGKGNFLFLDLHTETLESYPRLMLGPWSEGYKFWHPEHWSPLSGIPAPSSSASSKSEKSEDSSPK